MITFGSALTIIEVTWPALKEKIALINRPYHYEENNELYEIFIIDEVIVYRTQLIKGEVALNATVSQELNDEYITDFIANFKDQANAPLSSSATVTTSIAPRNDHEMIKEGRCKLVADASTASEFTLDLQFPAEHSVMQLWGCFADVEGHGEDDYVTMQIVDVDNLIGYGENTVLKEYDEVWCRTIAKMNDAIYTPDGAPGEIMGGLYARIVYHATDSTKTNIKLWADYILTVKS